MGAKSIILHNRAIAYRMPLFRELKEQMGDSVEIWIYQDTAATGDADIRSFPYWKLGVKRFSISAILKLLFAKFDTALLFGSHSYEIIFFFLILKARKKRFLFWTETWDWKVFDFESTLFMLAIQHISRQATRCLYPGQKTKDMYIRLGVPEHKMGFVPSVSRIEKTIGGTKNTNKRIIGYFGRLIQRKGVNILIDAFSGLDKSAFLLTIATSSADDDSEYSKDLLEKGRTNPGIEVKRLKSRQEITHYFNSLDIFVYPSYIYNGFAEPWGLALNEAISIGVPIVSTDAVAAAFDLIHDGKNGFIVNQGDAAALKLGILSASKLIKSEVAAYNKRFEPYYSYGTGASLFKEAILEINGRD